MPLDRCPHCDHQLGSPLQSSGRQVCLKCGWSDRSRSTPPPPQPDPQPSEPSPDEIKRLLAKATEESLQNMKPRRRKPQLMIHPTRGPYYR